jgi:hypothetical protein
VKEESRGKMRKREELVRERGETEKEEGTRREKGRDLETTMNAVGVVRFPNYLQAFLWVFIIQSRSRKDRGGSKAGARERVRG